MSVIKVDTKDLARVLDLLTDGDLPEARELLRELIGCCCPWVGPSVGSEVNE